MSCFISDFLYFAFLFLPLCCTLLPPSLHRCLWTTSITTMTSHQGASYDFVLITCCLIFKATHFHRDGHYIYVIRGWFCCCCCCCWQPWGSQISISPAAILMSHLCDTTILRVHSSQSNRPCASTNDNLSPQTCQEVETFTHMQVQMQCTYQISECRSIVHHYCCDESQHKVSGTDLSPPSCHKTKQSKFKPGRWNPIMGSSMITMTMKMLTKLEQQYTDAKGIKKQANSVKVDWIHLAQKHLTNSS